MALRTIGIGAAAVLGIVAAVGLVWGLSRVGVAIYSDVAPRQQAAERHVFENSPSYTLGKQQIIAKYRREYEASKDATEKASLRAAILDEAATVDKTQLDPSTRSFVESL